MAVHGFRVKKIRHRRNAASDWVVGWEVYGRTSGLAKPIRKRFEKKTDADRYCREMDAQAKAGTLPLTTRSQRGEQQPTLLEWFDRFLENRRKGTYKDKTATSHLTRRNQVQHWLETAGGFDRAIGAFRRQDFEDMVEFLRTQPLPTKTRSASDRTINSILESLKAVYNFALAHQDEENERRAMIGDTPVRWVTRNPLKGIRTIRTGKAMRYSAWTPHELTTIEAHLPEFYRPYFRVLVQTGLRAEEFCNLAWTQVNFADRILIITPIGPNRPKHDMTRHIPFADSVHDILRKQVGKHSTWVFTRMSGKERVSQQELRRNIQRAIEASGLAINGRVLHCTRATFITNLFREGHAIGEIMDLAGHRNPKVTMGYVMVDEEAKRKAVASLGKYFED
jgi:integrase